MDAARAVLPLWVVWGPVAWMGLLSALLCWASVRAGAAVARWGQPATPPEGWMERARRAFPARRASQVMMAAIPAGAALLLYQSHTSLTPLSPLAFGLLLGGAGLGAAVLARLQVERHALGERVGVGRWLGGVLVLWLLLLPHVVFGLALLVLYPRPFIHWVLALPWALCALLAVAGALGGGVWLARAVGLLRRPSPRLVAVVGALTARTGLRPRFVYEARFLAPNAVAFPLTGALVVSERLLPLLSDAQLSAVCAHELGHLSEPWRVKLARAGLSLSGLVPCLLQPPLAQAAGDVLSQELLLLGCLAPTLVLLLLTRGLLRRMEVRADATVKEVGEDGEAYARALEAIYRVRLMPAVLSADMRSPHPHLYDRMLAAGVQPTEPRPPPPSSRHTLAGVLVSLAVFLVGGLGSWYGMYYGCWAMPRTDAESGYLWALACGQDAGTLEGLSLLRAEEGRLAEALALREGAYDAACGNPAEHLAHLAQLMARTGRCSEAQVRLQAARLLNARYEMSEEAAEVIEAAGVLVQTCAPSDEEVKADAVP